MSRLLSRLKKLILPTLVGVFLLDFTAFICLQYYYIAYWPRTPDAVHGRVVPYNVHGTVFDLSQAEVDQLDYMYWGGFGTALIAGALAVRDRTSKHR